MKHNFKNGGQHHEVTRSFVSLIKYFKSFLEQFAKSTLESFRGACYNQGVTDECQSTIVSSNVSMKEEVPEKVALRRESLRNENYLEDLYWLRKMSHTSVQGDVKDLQNKCIAASKDIENALQN